MNLLLEKIVDAGNLEKERVLFKALADEQVGAYALFKSKKTGEGYVSSKVLSTFWFPDQEIKKGDLVVLYTKAGMSTTKQNTAGNASYFFYWGETEPLWKNPDDVAVLLNINEWAFKSSS